MKIELGKNLIPFSDTEAGGSGTTAIDIFESLSDSLDGKEKPEGKEDEKEEDESEVIPLKNKEKDDDDKKEDERDKEDSEEDEDDEDKDDEEDDLEDEKEDEEEDELELAKIPTRSQIKAKYPNIFKEFKALDHIFHREKAYAEVFPTVKDAKAAKEDIGEYVKIQEELLNGNVTGTLNRVKISNPKAYEKIANNIIESLIAVDKESYIEPARVVFKSGLNNLYSIAQQALKKDPANKRAEQMMIAAELIHEGLFGSSEVTPYSKETKEEDKENPEVEKLKRERQAIDHEKFNEAHSKVTSRFGDLVTRTLDKNIDKNNVLSTYVKNNLIKDIKEELDKQLIADRRFGGIVKKLYERAKEGNFNQESIDNILTALKNKAGSILPDIMRAKKGEALKGSGKVRNIKTRELSRDKDEGETATTRSSRNDDSEKKLTRNQRDKETDSPQPGESAFDYLNRKLGA